MGILDLAKLLRSGELSSELLTKKYIEKIKEKNPTLNAYVNTTFELALEQAKHADKDLKNGNANILCGIPMNLKDNITTCGIETTCCSKILRGYVPFYNATVWENLKSKGAVLLGKTNMDEFAMGTSGETSCFGGTQNPIDKTKVAGGSSGGGACSVSADLSVYAIGSDTGGSVREPASFCGVVGLKPTYGAISRYGLISYASSFDQIGIISNSVEDCSIIFDEIKGKDKFDDTSIDYYKNTFDNLHSEIKGLKIGVVKGLLDDCDIEIASQIEKAISFFKDNGAKLVEISLPSLELSLSAYYILACAQASSNLGRYDGIRYGARTGQYQDLDEMMIKTRTENFGEEVKRRIMLGTFVLSSGHKDEYYKKALNSKELIKSDFSNAFTSCDCIITPTVPTTAFKKGFAINNLIKGYKSDKYTAPVSVAGLPAISIPCGVDKCGLPIGMQIIGNYFEEDKILNVAHFYEKRADKGVV